MLTLYRIALYLALPVLLLRLLGRALKDRRYFERILQRFGFAYRRAKPGGVWIHAVSVGEVNAATPLVNYLLETRPDMPVTLTTMTPTGADRVEKTFAGRVRHCYLPYDYPGAVNRFLRATAPRLGLCMETEIWPNLIAACHRREVPLVYVNVRLSRRAHQGYRRVRKLIRPTLAKVQGFAVQTRLDARRLTRLGASPAAVRVTGSVKFDVELKPSVTEAAQSVRRTLGRERPVWVAGSTHDGEEAQVLEAFARVRKEIDSLLLIIAPRHPQRFGAVAKLCARRGFTPALRSETTGPLPADTAVYVADSMGELPMLIAAADLAFIGGSLAPVGGHNVLEAAAVGVPVVFGPHMFNFARIADLLIERAAGIQVLNADELAEVALRLLSDPVLRGQYGERGRELVEQNRGALARVCELVDETLGKV